ncbi:MAG: hypothetical protein ACR2OA_12270, partial [Rubripirellula sp.]
AACMRRRKSRRATGTASRIQDAHKEHQGSHSTVSQPERPTGNQPPTRNQRPTRNRTALHHSAHDIRGCHQLDNNQRDTAPEHDQERPSLPTKQLRRSE